MSLPPRVVHSLAAEADVAVATVKRRLAGKPLRPSTAARLDAAAEKLAVTLPALEPAAPGAGS